LNNLNVFQSPSSLNTIINDDIQKSKLNALAVAISVLAVLCDNPGAAIISCLIFHFTQLFADSPLASKLAIEKRKIL
jgi:hypothetical protein